MEEKVPIHLKVVTRTARNNLKADKSKASLFLMEKLADDRESVLNTIACKAGKYLKMNKFKAFRVLLERLEAQQKMIADGVAKKTDGCAKRNRSRVVSLLAVSFCLFAHSQGYCADASHASSLDSVTKSVMDIVFGSGIKKSILVLAAAWGLFQAVSSGSFKPLLLWGGIGLAIAYVPKLIDIIANVG